MNVQASSDPPRCLHKFTYRKGRHKYIGLLADVAKPSSLVLSICPWGTNCMDIIGLFILQALCLLLVHLTQNVT